MCTHGTIHEVVCTTKSKVSFNTKRNKTKCTLKMNSVDIKIDKGTPSQFNH